jgi:uncharacterized protein YecE (DUF72 family)
VATSAGGYVRLHGRDYQQWFSKTADVRERYDYLYSARKLEPWVDRIKTIAEETQDTYVIANNHSLGNVVVNVFELTAVLTIGKSILPSS